MAQVDTAEVIRSIYQAFNDKDLDRLMSYAQADAKVLNVPFGKAIDLRDYVSNWATAVPDGQIAGVILVASADLVAAEFIGRGTQTGRLLGPAGEIAPTHKRVEMRFCEVYDLSDGKVTGVRAYFDSATMMSQLELFRAPGMRPEAYQPGMQH